ncbi:MAG: glycerol-3-phosphate 1-O-acyltransferase PlsY [Deltaproteobacteria bacterium]|nr:glycerol-3-phosphate 1-O-acyltransferase PlsY [Deltaproteobacteria bacterium]
MKPLFALYLLGGYLLGAVPFGLLVARVWGAPDPRTLGSRNIGATNVSRAAGKSAGVATLLLDAAKGAVPVILTGLWFPAWQAALVGLAAFAGHCWPVYLRFRGGKGVATALGVYAALSPLVLVGVLAVLVVGVRFTGFMSVGSMAGCLSAPLWMLALALPAEEIMVSLAMGLLVLFSHRANLTRLRAGTEHGWR